MRKLKKRRNIPACGADELAAATGAMHAFRAEKLARGVALPLQPVHENKYFKRFLSIGRMCAAAGADVRAYTDYVFSASGRNAYAVTPATLDDPKFVTAFKRDVRAGREGAAGDWVRLMRSLLEASERTGTPEDVILANPLRAYPSWFRALAHDDPSPRILAIYGAAALDELEADESLLRFAVEKFPKRLTALRNYAGGGNA